MKSKICKTAALLIAAANVLYGQSIIHPWKVVDNGGGKSTAGGLTLQASIGQPAVATMSGGGITAEEGYIPGLRTLSGVSLSIAFEVGPQWTMLSVPAVVQDYSKAALFPSGISPAFAFTPSGYSVRDTLENGTGYWIKFGPADTVQMSGVALGYDTVDVGANWNMIGSLSYPFPTSAVEPVPPLTIVSSFFGYASGAGYFPAGTIEPGGGYWVKVSQAGQIVFNASSLRAAGHLVVKEKKKDLREVLADTSEMNSLRFVDADGKKRTLLFSTAKQDIDLERYELPPVPPQGSFDARFRSQRTVETVSDKQPGVQTFPIMLSSAEFPITIHWNVVEQTGRSSLVITHPDGSQRTYLLEGTGTVTLTETEFLGVKLLMTPVSSGEVPAVFALHQNFPNPFNPKTVIKYDLPSESKVTLKVFNILGEGVRTLVSEVQEAGYRSIEWDSRNNAGLAVASGVYFYRIEMASISDRSNSFSQVKRMLLLK